MGLRAVVFGATGMVGEGVLHESLNHASVDAVLVIGRRTCGVQHGKLNEIIHDNFFDYDKLRDQLSGYNACFFCLGVSSVGMKEGEYTRLTYDLTMSAAKMLSALNPGMTFCYISGAGTDSTEHGKLMWARVKGRTENHLMALPFKAVYLFRPGFIRPTHGLRNAPWPLRALGALYPALHAVMPRYVCTLEHLGLAMIHVSCEGYGKHILENEDITQAGERAPASGA